MKDLYSAALTSRLFSLFARPLLAQWLAVGVQKEPGWRTQPDRVIQIGYNALSTPAFESRLQMMTLRQTLRHLFVQGHGLGQGPQEILDLAQVIQIENLSELHLVDLQLNMSRHVTLPSLKVLIVFRVSFDNPSTLSRSVFPSLEALATSFSGRAGKFEAFKRLAAHLEVVHVPELAVPHGPYPEDRFTLPPENSMVDFDASDLLYEGCGNVLWSQAQHVRLVENGSYQVVMVWQELLRQVRSSPTLKLLALAPLPASMNVEALQAYLQLRTECQNRGIELAFEEEGDRAWWPLGSVSAVFWSFKRLQKKKMEDQDVRD
ncbi:hypothetical protein JCM3765_005314 [Sporobolomyces pararoseus]